MKEAGRGGGAESRELKPMVGADEEVAILQEFHFYFFSLFVFTDCTSSGEVFVLCITQDVLLFLFVSLPITWMAEFLSQLRPSPVKVRWKELCHMKEMQYHFIRVCMHAMWYTQTAPTAEYSQNKMTLEFIGLFWL